MYIDNLRPFIVGRARIHLSIERWRVCETWFAPSMAGVDSAGLGEVLQNVLASFSTDDRGLLVQVRYPTLSSPSPSLPSRCSLTLANRRHARTCS
jgi:actin-related protein 5